METADVRPPGLREPYPAPDQAPAPLVPAQPPLHLPRPPTCMQEKVSSMGMGVCMRHAIWQATATGGGVKGSMGALMINYMLHAPHASHAPRAPHAQHPTRSPRNGQPRANASPLLLRLRLCAPPSAGAPTVRGNARTLRPGQLPGGMQGRLDHKPGSTLLFKLHPILHAHKSSAKDLT